MYGTDIITMRGEAELLYICLGTRSDDQSQARHLNWKVVFSNELAVNALSSHYSTPQPTLRVNFIERGTISSLYVIADYYPVIAFARKLRNLHPNRLYNSPCLSIVACCTRNTKSNQNPTVNFELVLYASFVCLSEFSGYCIQSQNQEPR